MVEVKNDSSNKSDSATPRAAKPAWPLWLAVLAFHGAVLMGLDAALTVNRLAAEEPTVLSAAILTERTPEPAKPKTRPAPAKSPEQTPPALPPTPAPLPAPPETTPETSPEPAVPVAIAPEPSTTLPAIASLSPVPAPPSSTPSPQPAPVLASQPARVPTSVDLRYKLIKGNDSAKASLIWKTSQGADGANHYEAALEATYFGFSAFKQISLGTVQLTTGLQPTKYSDKRRGKSEQAAHFERDKKAIVFSNNRPEAALVAGSQDRVSMFVQLASRLAAEPSHYAAGQTIAMPVANVDELENWIFEVQAKEILALPIGELEAIKLTRRPRRAFDQMVELWLAPSQQYLPVRIRLTDSSGVSDLLLSSSDKL